VTGPWAALPRSFATEVRKERRSLSTEIVHKIRGTVTEFNRPLSGKFAVGMQLGVETALLEFPELVESGGEPTAERLRVYRALGYGERLEGRSLEPLQAAYRLGGRVAWRRYARVGRRTGMQTDEMVTLAEAIFAHLDVIAAASASGYADARAGQASRAGVLGRRQRLRDLLMAGTPAVQLEQSAAAADWPLPDRLACVALGPPPEPGPPAARGRRAAVDLLADLDRPDPYLVLRDPVGDLQDGVLINLLRDRGAVVGPSVPPPMAPDSLRWARAVRAKLPPAALAKGPVMCDHALPSVLLLGDEPLLRVLADRRLRVLGELTPKQRHRLEATLLAWFETGRGSAPQIAARLGVHPQTARQRLHRIQELFGPDLADPQARFELELALRGRFAFESFVESD
jgi:hypothetical protein